jgi:hypothetical protein
MTTFEALKNLDDSEFHSLGDALLRRLEHRYRRLRTHGLNERGESIKGQPDSYVGETAQACEIAFTYSVQRKGWWTKIVEDVKDVVRASPGVKEIVVATPRDVNREGPRGGGDTSNDWLAAAKKEAGEASLRIYDGPEIAGYLDREHQDLRYDHLRIPYSRLSPQSIVASCCRANSDAVAELVASGRFDPARYAPRDADRELFALWQRALRRETTAVSAGREPARLIPLVNDAGVGKTSLLAAFVRSAGSVLPVILTPAQRSRILPGPIYERLYSPRRSPS